MGYMEERLTAEERAFLQQIFEESSWAGFGGRENRVVLDPAGGDPDVLGQLLSGAPLELRARHDGYVLRFELSVERPPTGSPVALRFGVPTVIDERLEPRCARVNPQPGEVRVRETTGALRHCDLLDISASGMRLRAAGPVRGERTDVELELRLDQERCRVAAQVVRTGESGRGARRQLGLRFVDLDTGARETINRFVLRHHPLFRASRRTLTA